jgi:hypothetical protein
MRFVKQTRTILIALRAWCGAKTTTGRTCSNLLEMTENYTKSEHSGQREQLRANIAQQKERLTGKPSA